ncbi:MAG: exodeoxyribonuclease VII small subunit [Pseudomonadota bacterium]
MAKSRDTAEAPFHFEKAIASLENIVEQIESGQLSLEKSLERFEEGVKLSRSCQRALQDAEQRVRLAIDNPVATTAETQ